MSAEMSSMQKLNKKLKLAIKRSKSSKNEVETQKRRERGSVGDKMSKSVVDDRVDAFTSSKRKRVYPVQDTGEEGTRGNKRKHSIQKGRNRLEDDIGKEKVKGERKNSLKVGLSNANKSFVDKNRTSHRTMWVSAGKRNGTLGTKQSHLKGKDRVGSAKASDGKLKTKAKMADRIAPVEVDSGLKISKKTFSRSKSDSNKHLNQGQSKSSDVSLTKTSKKSAQDKKILDDDLEVTENRPRKRRTKIRIDPHDLSNKRLDDGVVINERTKEKIEDLEEDVKISKNAEFRAIRPSPSILSFVEDNLLGRRRLIELRRAGYNIELSAPLDNIPFSTSSERERIEENVFRNKLEFFAAAKVSSSFPPPDLPEIAFAGRSNVGKSSLLNALTRQWGVVRTSDKPGLTQTINFFKLGSKLCLVDLPGYGFAYAKEEVKDAWEELVKEYVSTRVGLRRVCVLIDTKWGMKPRDHELIDLMERSETRYQIVLTKTDTVFPIDVARRAMQIEESLKTNKSIVHPVMMASSKSGAGIRSLRTVLTKIARFAKL